MLIFCIMLTFAHIFMTFDRYLLGDICGIDDKKSHLRAKKCKISYFYASQGNAATCLRCGG